LQICVITGFELAIQGIFVVAHLEANVEIFRLTLALASSMAGVY
jgi:hypothetical protein